MKVCYAREQKLPQARRDRRWTTQTSPSQNLDHRRRRAATHFTVEGPFDLFISTVVRVARLLAGLLVRLQSKTRAVCRFSHIDCTFAQLNISAFPATLRRLRFRKSNHRSQQSAVSVFAGEDYSSVGLAGCRIL